MSVLTSSRAWRRGALWAALACLVCAAAARGQAMRAGPPPARIVNGMPTGAYPAVGILVAGGQLCSATLIGCQTVVTAAHCVCPAAADTYAQCQRLGPPDPNQVFFLSQYALLARVSAVHVHPNYDFSRGGDVAVVTLAAPLSGIEPLPINTTRKPPVDTPGTIVGFGRTGGAPDLVPELGIKRAAPVVTAACPTAMGGDPGIPSANHLCIDVLDASAGGTCQGDSGGPLLVDLGAGAQVGGVASGAAKDAPVFDCLPPSLSFFTDVFRYRSFVMSVLDGDDAPCGALPAVGSPGTQVRTIEGAVAAGTGPFETTVEVPRGADLLRVNLNGELLTPNGFNDFDLFVNFGAPASAVSRLCGDTNATAYGACEIADPQPGTWHITVDPIAGAGDFQLIVTRFGVAPACAGDCNGDGRVGIDELVRDVGIVLDGGIEQCPAADGNGDGATRIEDLVAAVAAALDGCA